MFMGLILKIFLTLQVTWTYKTKIKKIAFPRHYGPYSVTTLLVSNSLLAYNMIYNTILGFNRFNMNNSISVDQFAVKNSPFLYTGCHSYLLYGQNII